VIGTSVDLVLLGHNFGEKRKKKRRRRRMVEAR
jgi:hypothetical protein